MEHEALYSEIRDLSLRLSTQDKLIQSMFKYIAEIQEELAQLKEAQANE